MSDPGEDVLEAMLTAPFEVRVTADQAKALEKAYIKSKVLGYNMLSGDPEIAKLLSDLYAQIEVRADKVIKLTELLKGVTFGSAEEG